MISQVSHDINTGPILARFYHNTACLQEHDHIWSLVMIWINVLAASGLFWSESVLFYVLFCNVTACIREHDSICILVIIQLAAPDRFLSGSVIFRLGYRTIQAGQQHPSGCSPILVYHGMLTGTKEKEPVNHSGLMAPWILVIFVICRVCPKKHASGCVLIGMDTAPSTCISSHCPVNGGLKLLIQSQTSTAPLKVGNGEIISSHAIKLKWLFIHAGIKVDPC